MIKVNLDLRKAAEESGVRQWQIADRLGITEQKLCVMLRKELPDDVKERILTIIKELKEGEV